MARLFTDGAEMGDALAFTTSSCTLSTSTKRSGNYGYVTYGGSQNLQKTINSLTEIYIRFGYYDGSLYGTVTPLRWLNGVTVLGSLRLSNTTRKFSFYTGTGTLVSTGSIVATSGTWHLIEVHIKFADSGGLLELRIDGLQDSDATFSGDTKPGAETSINSISLQSAQADSTINTDDIAINDTSGAVDNSWCGDGHVIALVPNANGDLSQLSGSDGNSTDNYLLVDETPSNSDTDYVEGSTVDQKDLYNLSASGLTNVNISRVWGEARSKDTTTAGGLLAITVKTEGTEYDSGDIALPTSYAAVKGPEYLVNPQTGIAWTIAELDALQVGPKTRS